eukprot:GHVO01001903.1.p2 GENE.GHVO01001903.1~~GHVO01001903.1.p2  ORF type:complete len:106 (+),score=3.27 GHVO01001903.1:218-535(+)
MTDSAVALPIVSKLVGLLTICLTDEILSPMQNLAEAMLSEVFSALPKTLFEDKMILSSLSPDCETNTEGSNMTGSEAPKTASEPTAIALGAANSVSSPPLTSLRS